MLVIHESQFDISIVFKIVLDSLNLPLFLKIAFWSLSQIHGSETFYS